MKVPLAPETLVGKPFGLERLQAVRDEIDRAEPQTRAEIARRICARLQWVDRLGRPQLMSARVALLRLHRRGFIQLPEPRNGNGNGRRPRISSGEFRDKGVVSVPADQLDGLTLTEVKTRVQSVLWNTAIERFHYMGHGTMAGAQKRYLIEWAGGLLGAIGFGAAAWKLAPRDRFIGWEDDARRQKGLHLIVNNTRFLLLPWVHSPNLASKVLGMCARIVPNDFFRSYGYRPVLMETFVESERFSGKCYRAANWTCVGRTQGRGKLDVKHEQALSVKDIWLLPLVRNFRELLCGEHAPQSAVA